MAGAAAGSKADQDSTEGLPSDEIFFYEDALRQGRSVIILMANGATEAARAREILAESGAESLDAAREAWWIGLQDAESEHYRALGYNFEQDRAAYRAGFEAALRPSVRGKSHAEAGESLKREYPEWETGRSGPALPGDVSIGKSGCSRGISPPQPHPVTFPHREHPDDRRGVARRDIAGVVYPQIDSREPDHDRGSARCRPQCRPLSSRLQPLGDHRRKHTIETRRQHRVAARKAVGRGQTVFEKHLWTRRRNSTFNVESSASPPAAAIKKTIAARFLPAAANRHTTNAPKGTSTKCDPNIVTTRKNAVSAGDAQACNPSRTAASNANVELKMPSVARPRKNSINDPPTAARNPPVNSLV